MIRLIEIKQAMERVSIRASSHNSLNNLYIFIDHFSNMITLTSHFTNSKLTTVLAGMSHTGKAEWVFSDA